MFYGVTTAVLAKRLFLHLVVLSQNLCYNDNVVLVPDSVVLKTQCHVMRCLFIEKMPELFTYGCHEQIHFEGRPPSAVVAQTEDKQGCEAAPEENGPTEKY